MDPIGLALENFDAVGVWRTQEAGVGIDASGELADGSRIDGAVELRESLLRRPEVLVGTMTEKLLTYALGRTSRLTTCRPCATIVRSVRARTAIASRRSCAAS